MASQFIIYGLLDPRTDELRYVGKSASGMVRPKAHCFPSQLRHHNRRVAWIKSLLAADVKPEIAVLEEVENAESLPELEKLAIQHYRSMGFDLVNGTDGGEGTLGRKLSAEARAKISAARKGWCPSDDTRRRMSEGQKHRAPFSEEHLSHLTDAQRLRRDTTNVSEETKRKIAAWNIGRKMSDEAKAKMSAANKARAAKPPSPSTFSADVKAKMSASAKARWERYRLMKKES
jgi:hypothetical protein